MMMLEEPGDDNICSRSMWCWFDVSFCEMICCAAGSAYKDKEEVTNARDRVVGEISSSLSRRRPLISHFVHVGERSSVFLVLILSQADPIIWSFFLSGIPQGVTHQKTGTR